jgi:hypothetical protein
MRPQRAAALERRERRARRAEQAALFRRALLRLLLRVVHALDCWSAVRLRMIADPTTSSGRSRTLCFVWSSLLLYNDDDDAHGRRRGALLVLRNDEQHRGENDYDGNALRRWYQDARLGAALLARQDGHIQWPTLPAAAAAAAAAATVIPKRKHRYNPTPSERNREKAMRRLRSRLRKRALVEQLICDHERTIMERDRRVAVVVVRGTADHLRRVLLLELEPAARGPPTSVVVQRRVDLLSSMFAD